MSSSTLLDALRRSSTFGSEFDAADAAQLFRSSLLRDAHRFLAILSTGMQMRRGDLVLRVASQQVLLKTFLLSRE